MKDRTIVSLFALFCITVLASLWIGMGHNHNSLTIVVGMIGTITGYTFGSTKGLKP